MTRRKSLLRRLPKIDATLCNQRKGLSICTRKRDHEGPHHDELRGKEWSNAMG